MPLLLPYEWKPFFFVAWELGNSEGTKWSPRSLDLRPELLFFSNNKMHLINSALTAFYSAGFNLFSFIHSREGKKDSAWPAPWGPGVLVYQSGLHLFSMRGLLRAPLSSWNETAVFLLSGCERGWNHSLCELLPFVLCKDKDRKALHNYT